MSLTIFSKQRGQVALFQDPSLPGVASLQLENWAGAQSMRSIITRVAISSSCNFQVLHTLGGEAFLYVFGDRVGQVIISGLAFDSFCDTAGGQLGLERVAAFYNQNRLVSRKLPLKMTIGSSLTFKMYLGGVQTDVEDVANRIWRFSFILLEIPKPLPRLNGGSSAEDDEDGEDDSEDGDGTGVNVDDGEDENTYQQLPVNAANTADPGGYDPQQAIVPLTAGDGYATYGTGPAVEVQGFSLS